MGFMVQSSMAADMAVKAPPIVAPVVSHWDGLYVSFSAGGTWTNAKSSEFDSNTDTLALATGLNVKGVVLAGPGGSINIPYSYSDSMSGNNMGAVATFTMGYNVVWGSWVAGIQSEVSYNKNDITLKGTGFDQASLVIGPFSARDTRTADVSAHLENNWTISEMARIGYLIAPDWQVYGLVGWSWGGFKYDGYSTARTGLDAIGLAGLIGPTFAPAGRNDNVSFTMSGFTYGAGVEKDFGWLRAFVQWKGINYGSHSESLPANAAGALNLNLQLAPAVNGFANVNDTVLGSAARSFKVDVQQVTAGVTIPLNWRP